MSAKRRPASRTIQVDRIISVGRDRETGGAVIRPKDADGRTIALRLWKHQLRTLARGASGLVEALEGERKHPIVKLNCTSRRELHERGCRPPC